MIINPLVQVAIYALILSNILAARLPGIDNQFSYAIYLMAGLLAWTLFNEVVSRCLNLFIEQANVMKKMSFPRITLPAIVIGSSLLNNIFLFLAMICIFAFLGHRFSMAMVWLLPLTLILLAFATGIGLILGVINVFIRDVGQVVPIVLQMWFWFTPIVYPVSIVPQSFQYWLGFNPIYSLTSAYQDVLLYGVSPQVESLLGVFITAIVVMVFSLLLFRRASAELVDVL